MRGRLASTRLLYAVRVSLTVSPVAYSSPKQSEGPRAVHRQPSREQAGVDGAVVAASGEATLGWVEDEPHLPGGRSEAGQPAADVLHTARKADVIQKGKRQVSQQQQHEVQAAEPPQRAALPAGPPLEPPPQRS